MLTVADELALSAIERDNPELHDLIQRHIESRAGTLRSQSRDQKDQFKERFWQRGYRAGWTAAVTAAQAGPLADEPPATFMGADIS